MLAGVFVQFHAVVTLVGDPIFMAIGTCADCLLVFVSAGSVTGSWVYGSAGSFHCSYHGGELLHLDRLLFALGLHLFEQSAVSVDGTTDWAPSDAWSTVT